MPAERRFDPETAAERHRAMKSREQLVQRRITQWLRARHPRLYGEARAAALTEIASTHGPLPGDKP
jgi:hypothetical protein